LNRLLFAGVAAGALSCATIAAPAAAQAIPTASTQTSGVSQETALALTARLDALERRNEALEKQIAALKAGIAAGDQAVRKEPGATKVTLRDTRPTIATADNAFTASLRGVFQLDAAQYDQRRAGPTITDFRRGSFGDATENDRARDMADGANFRRVRFGIEGKAFGDWDYSFLYDFGGTGVEAGGVINQAWVQYSGLPLAKLRVGAFAPPVSMDDATSTNGMTFLERSAVGEMVRGLAGGDARTGASILAGGERWNAAVSVTGNTVGVSSFDEQLAVIGRLAVLPVKTDDSLVHLGLNSTQIITPAATGPNVAPGAATPVRLRERPETRVEGVRLVDTGALDANGLSTWGLEAAAQRKAFLVQGEYFRIDVDRKGAVADPDFSGWYAQASWTMTGQPRRYAIAAAAFDAPKVDKPFNPRKGDWGAWEVAARWSELDLDDGAVRGGEQQIFTLGLNWFPNNNVRLMANFQDVEVVRLSPGGTVFGAGALTPAAGVNVGQKLQTWSLRTQYAF